MPSSDGELELELARNYFGKLDQERSPRPTTETKGDESMFKLTLKTDNAAFEDGADGASETARILREVAARLDGGARGTFPVRDLNGNTVGEASLTSDGEEG